MTSVAEISLQNFWESSLRSESQFLDKLFSVGGEIYKLFPQKIKKPTSAIIMKQGDDQGSMKKGINIVTCKIEQQKIRSIWLDKSRVSHKLSVQGELQSLFLMKSTAIRALNCKYYDPMTATGQQMHLTDMLISRSSCIRDLPRTKPHF